MWVTGRFLPTFHESKSFGLASQGHNCLHMTIRLIRVSQINFGEVRHVQGPRSVHKKVHRLNNICSVIYLAPIETQQPNPCVRTEAHHQEKHPIQGKQGYLMRTSIKSRSLGSVTCPSRPPVVVKVTAAPVGSNCTCKVVGAADREESGTHRQRRVYLGRMA